MKVLISGAFGQSTWLNPLFPAIAQACGELGHVVLPLDVSFQDCPNGWQKAFERLMTVPLRVVGASKQLVKPWLPWTAVHQQEAALLRAVAEFRPDTLLVMTYVRYRPQVLVQCRDMGVRRLVGWFLEGPAHEFRAEAECRMFDHYFCIHRHIDAAHAACIEWLPALSLDARHFHPLPQAVRRQRIVFVGAYSARRADHLRALRGMPLEIWGPGPWSRDADLRSMFKGEFIWGEQLNRLYNESAIVVNLSSWDPSLSGLTQRIIDVPATGACLLTDDSTDVRQIFDVGHEIDVFTSPEDLAAKCRLYLDDETAREAMARAGHERALKFPTSLHLAQRLLA